jgi:hypothetical protein
LLTNFNIIRELKIKRADNDGIITNDVTRIIPLIAASVSALGVALAARKALLL